MSITNTSCSYPKSRADSELSGSSALRRIDQDPELPKSATVALLVEYFLFAQVILALPSAPRGLAKRFATDVRKLVALIGRTAFQEGSPRCAAMLLILGPVLLRYGLRTFSSKTQIEARSPFLYTMQ